MLFMQLLSIVGTNFPLEIVSRSVECKQRIMTSSNWSHVLCLPVPELQGEPDDVAKEKCIMATKQVCVEPIVSATAKTVNMFRVETVKNDWLTVPTLTLNNDFTHI